MSKKATAPVRGLLSGGLAGKAEQLAAAMVANEARKRRLRPYKGELAKPMQFPLRGFLGNADPLAESRAQAERFHRLMLLFEHHEVAPFDWARLALALIEAHVPGLRYGPPKRGRGRPRTKPSGGLLDPHAVRPVGKRGHPREWDDEMLQALVFHADRWKEEQRANGITRKPTDAAYIRAQCEEYARAHNKRAQSVFKESAGRWRNALSRARKTVSKPKVNPI